MTIIQTPTEQPVHEPVVEMGRVAGISDAVYAVALTLLVLDIRLPESVLAQELPGAILELLPKLLVYLISFVIIGGSWGSHQRMVAQIKRGDGPFVWFNLFSLLFITLLPASAVLLGRYPTSFLAIVVFAFDVVLIQLTAWLLWRHAHNSQLINPFLDSRIVDGIGRRLVLSGIVFMLSIPFALLSFHIVYGLWISLFILLFTTDWLAWQQADRTEKIVIPRNGARDLRVHMTHGMGRLQIQAGSNNETAVTGIFGGGLNAEAQQDAETLNILMQSKGKQGFMSWRYPWAWGRVNTMDWQVELTRELPTVLDIDTGAGQAFLDLADLNIAQLKLTAGGSSVDIHFPAHAGQTKVDIDASWVSLILRVPLNVAAIIRMEKSVTNAEVDLNRFVMITNGVEYRTREDETVTNQIDIRINMGLGSIKIL